MDEDEVRTQSAVSSVLSQKAIACKFTILTRPGVRGSRQELTTVKEVTCRVGTASLGGVHTEPPG